MKSKKFEVHTREGVEKITVFTSQFLALFAQRGARQKDWCTLDWWPISVVVVFRVSACVRASVCVYNIMIEIFRVCMTLQDIVGARASRQAIQNREEKLITIVRAYTYSS